MSKAPPLTPVEARNILLRMLRSSMSHRDREHRESEDVAQSLVGDLLAGSTGFFELDAESQVSYLRVAAAHKLAALARADRALKRGGDQRHTDLESAFAPGSPSPGPATVAAQHEELDALDLALDTVDPETRAVIALHTQGCPHDVLADLLRVSNDASRQRYSRALRDLRLLTEHSLGASWEAIATSIGTSPERARKRYEVLLASGLRMSAASRGGG